ncbi:MAG: CBS domain-containing protein [Rhodospirillaceae bacterium]
MTMHPSLPVRAVMTRKPIIVDGLATVTEAVALMRSNRVSSLVIDRRDEHDEYGMVVISDIADQVIAKDRHPDRVNVYEIMSKPLLHVEADMEVRYAMRLISRFGLSRSIVTDKGVVIGIVTLRDLVLGSMAAQTGEGAPTTQATAAPVSTSETAS